MHATNLTFFEAPRRLGKIALVLAPLALSACFSDRAAEPTADAATAAGVDQTAADVDTSRAADTDPDLGAPADAANPGADADIAADAAVPVDSAADQFAVDVPLDAPVAPDGDVAQPDTAPNCPPGGAKPETCNGQDDDCDGQTDEDAAANCPSGPPCTKAVCFEGACSALADLGSTAACSDGSACTTGDVCTKGVCSGAAVACDDGKPCTTDGCATVGGCTHQDAAVPCDDGNACTTGDACKGGACAAGTFIACDDGDPCTDDACQAAACAHLPNAATCSDGDACTSGEACAGGSCKGGKPTACDDKNPCTADACDPATGKCALTPNAGVCDDADACTSGDVCTAGACAGKKFACSDGNACTDDGCDKASGCTFQANAAACDDGNACTAIDVCAKGWCAGAAKACGDGNPCTDDGCDPAKGCGFANNAAPCNDGNLCTTDDACKAGACAAGGVLPCGDGNPCTQDSCDKAKGCVFLAAAGTCSDGDACTTGDGCQGGVCQSGKGAGCDDGNACTVDGCDKGTGACSNKAVMTGGCDDGNACTVGDGCQNGVCKTAPAPCNDGDACTTDSCDTPSGACKYAGIANCAKPPCGSQADCKVGFCDAKTHACLPCLAHADCGSGKVCNAGACEVGVQCSNAAACKATKHVCDAAAGLCVDCLGEADCGSGQTCLASKCVAKVVCSSDKQCPGVCGKGIGICVECNVAADCAGKGWCGSDRVCHPVVCQESACLGGGAGGWYQCKAEGSGYAAAVGCDDGNPCTVDACDAKVGCKKVNAADGAGCPGGTCGGGVCKGVVRVATSYDTACAIDQQGVLKCWGRNNYGQLGDGTTIDRSVPTAVIGLPEAVTAVATSGQQTCAVTMDGSLYCWGRNHQGELGAGSTNKAPNPVPAKVNGVPACAGVATADGTTCALGVDGSVWCWGNTNFGQTGVGAVKSESSSQDASQPTPTKLLTLSKVTSVVAGSHHFCALQQGGTVACWGYHMYGQVGNGKSGGETYAQRGTPYPAGVAGVAGVTDLAATSNTTCALKEAGSVTCWGYNSEGQLGTGKVAAELPMSLAPVGTIALDQVVELDRTMEGFCARRKDASVWCWGSVPYGPFGVGDYAKPTPKSVPDLKATALGGRCAVEPSGTLRCWGWNRYGQVGDGSVGSDLDCCDSKPSPGIAVSLNPIVEIAVGNNESACAVDAQGKVHCWGQSGNVGLLGTGLDASSPSPVPTLPLPAAAVDVSIGAGIACAVLNNGAVWCWGSNSQGMLGDGTTYSQKQKSLKPVQATKVAAGATAISLKWDHGCALVAGSLLSCWGENNSNQSSSNGLSGVLEVGVGANFTCVRLADAKVRCWGAGYYGQIGNGSTSGSSTPNIVQGLAAATVLAVGRNHACAVDLAQGVRCWGSNDGGQCGNATGKGAYLDAVAVSGLPVVTKVFAGHNHTCAVASDGQPWCWGQNNTGQLGDGTIGTAAGQNWQPRKVINWTGKAVSMALGEYNTCALRDDGKAFCWGAAGSGSLGDGSAWKNTPTLVKNLP